MYTQKQVDRGLKLVGNLTKNKFALGDLALEVAPNVNNSMEWNTSPAKKELEDFAEAIGLSFRSLLEYRTVAATFPPTKRREDVNFTVHKTLVGVDNPPAALARRKTWTVRSADEYAGKSSRDGQIKSGQKINSSTLSKSEKVEIAREVMKDKDVAREAMRDQKVKGAVARAQSDEAAEKTILAKATKSPEQDMIDKTQEFLQARGFLNEARYALGKAIQSVQGQELNDGQRERLELLVESVKNAVGFLESAISGSGNFDAQVAALLGGA